MSVSKDEQEDWLTVCFKYLLFVFNFLFWVRELPVASETLYKIIFHLPSMIGIQRQAFLTSHYSCNWTHLFICLVPHSASSQSALTLLQFKSQSDPPGLFIMHFAPDGNGGVEVLQGISYPPVFDERNRSGHHPWLFSTPKVSSLRDVSGPSLLSFLHFLLLNQCFLPTLLPPLDGWGCRPGRGSVDAGGEEWLLKPAGLQHLCCLSMYPGGGWQPGGHYRIPGLLCCHPGAEELSVFGEMGDGLI